MKLIEAKNKLKLPNLNENQIRLIKLYSTSDPELEIPPDLERLKTPQLMGITGLITSMAIDVSSIAHFKSIIDDVIVFCLDAVLRHGK